LECSLFLLVVVVVEWVVVGDGWMLSLERCVALAGWWLELECVDVVSELVSSLWSQCVGVVEWLVVVDGRK
jgi:hypothetical protein